jgi:hypothetical protein
MNNRGSLAKPTALDLSLLTQLASRTVRSLGEYEDQKQVQTHETIKGRFLLVPRNA